MTNDQQYNKLWEEYRALGAAQPASFETYLVSEIHALRGLVTKPRLDLAPIKARRAAIDPGPWKIGRFGFDNVIVDAKDQIVARPPLGNLPKRYNAEFIANAPEDIDVLMAEIEQLCLELVTKHELSVNTQMNGDQIKYMVNRFLGWRLPEDFHPDCGVRFEPIYNAGSPYEGRYCPIGTNLLNAEQAEVMVRYMLDGMPTGIIEQLRAKAEAWDASEESVDRVMAQLEAEGLVGDRDPDAFTCQGCGAERKDRYCSSCGTRRSVN
jgi:hypothetical protein